VAGGDVLPSKAAMLHATGTTKLMFNGQAPAAVSPHLPAAPARADQPLDG
jgi:hypothetical protein